MNSVAGRGRDGSAVYTDHSWLMPTLVGRGCKMPHAMLCVRYEPTSLVGIEHEVFLACPKSLSWREGTTAH